MKGIKTYWQSDVFKITNKIAGIKIMLDKIKMHPMIKDSLINDINRVLTLLKKGKNRDS